MNDKLPDWATDRKISVTDFQRAAEEILRTGKAEISMGDGTVVFDYTDANKFPKLTFHTDIASRAIPLADPATCDHDWKEQATTEHHQFTSCQRCGWVKAKPRFTLDDIVAVPTPANPAFSRESYDEIRRQLSLDTEIDRLWLARIAMWPYPGYRSAPIFDVTTAGPERHWMQQPDPSTGDGNEEIVEVTDETGFFPKIKRRRFFPPTRWDRRRRK